MRAIARRLRRLEERFGPPLETWHSRQLRARLEAAHRRCGLPPIPPERLAELRGMSMVDILIAGRQRVAAARTGIREPKREATLPCDVMTPTALIE
jgi:hypothetical protein